MNGRQDIKHYLDINHSNIIKGETLISIIEEIISDLIKSDFILNQVLNDNFIKPYYKKSICKHFKVKFSKLYELINEFLVLTAINLKNLAINKIIEDDKLDINIHININNINDCLNIENLNHLEECIYNLEDDILLILNKIRKNEDFIKKIK